MHPYHPPPPRILQMRKVKPRIAQYPAIKIMALRLDLS